MREGNWDDLCIIRSGLLKLIRSKKDHVFERAIEALIQSLALKRGWYKDSSSLQGIEDTVNNLHELCQELWVLIQMQPSFFRLEKLIEAYGLVLRESNILFHTSHTLAFRPARVKSMCEVGRDIIDSIIGNSENKPSILYYVKFMQEGMKRLEKKTSSVKGKTAWEVIKVLAGSVSLGFPIGFTVHLEEVNTAAEIARKGTWKFIKNWLNQTSNKESWYKHTLVLMKVEELFMKPVKNRSNTSEDLQPSDIWVWLKKNKTATSWEWHYTKMQFLKNVIKRTEDDAIREKAIQEFALCCKKNEIWSQQDRNIQSQLLQTFLELILNDNVAVQVYKACIGMSNVKGNAIKDYERRDYGQIEFLRYVILHSNNDTLKEKAIQKLVSYRDNWTEWLHQSNQERDYFCKNFFQIIEECKNNPMLKHSKEKLPDLRLDPRLEHIRDTEGIRRKEMDSFAKRKKKCCILWGKVRALKEKVEKSFVILNPPVPFLPISRQGTLKIKSPNKSTETGFIKMNNEEYLSFRDVNVQPDGACLFRAIALGLRLTPNSEFSHEKLREKAAAHIAENSDSYSENIKVQIKDLFDANRSCLGDPDNLFHGIPGALKTKLTKTLAAGPDTEKAYIDSDEAVEDYIAHMFDPTAWGGEIELEVLAKLLKVELLIYNKSSANQPVVRIGESGNQQIHLLHTDDHYNLRIPIFPEMLKKLSPEIKTYVAAMQRNWAQAYKEKFGKQISQLKQQRKELEQEIVYLKAELNLFKTRFKKESYNSNKPPLSDSF